MPLNNEDTDEVIVKTENGIRLITLNKPTRKNALTPTMYSTVTNLINDANSDPSTKLIVYTGKGDYFCSGNDLGNFMEDSEEDLDTRAKAGQQMFKDYVSAFINCTKPIIVLMNGPAVGVGVTILGLCDIVYSTEKATLFTPFTKLGQSPEGCSSYIFPRLMGYSKASELLYFNAKITAKEAEECGLIGKVFPDNIFQAESWKRIKEMALLPTGSLMSAKELVRGREREKLHAINTTECDCLLERFRSEDFMNSMLAFFTKRGKL